MGWQSRASKLLATKDVARALEELSSEGKGNEEERQQPKKVELKETVVKQMEDLMMEGNLLEVRCIFIRELVPCYSFRLESSISISYPRDF